MKLKLLILTGIALLCCAAAHAQNSTAASQTDAKQMLAANRKIIDSLDNQLILILGERERIVKEIGIYKAKNHIAPLQAARFREVVDKGIAAGAKQGLSPQFITVIMNAIHDESLRIERDSTLMNQ